MKKLIEIEVNITHNRHPIVGQQGLVRYCIFCEFKV